MFEAVPSPYLVPFDGSFGIEDTRTTPPKDAPDTDELREELTRLVEELSDLQRNLYAEDRRAMLAVFQALDAAGKDGTIRAVTTGVSPAGFQVHSFRRPSTEELDHDFLWRTSRRLPERGRIGIFNRSYYEEVLVVRVHPELLDAQRIPDDASDGELWDQRFESIRDHELHLARNGTAIVKFWLHVSGEEQRERFLSRIDEPEKNWKFSEADVREREYRLAYLEAYEAALRATSRPWAPWYAIPADDKPYMRWCVADIMVRSLRTMSPHPPAVDGEQLERLARMRALLDGGDQ